MQLNRFTRKKSIFFCMKGLYITMNDELTRIIH